MMLKNNYNRGQRNRIKNSVIGKGSKKHSLILYTHIGQRRSRAGTAY